MSTTNREGSTNMRERIFSAPTHSSADLGEGTGFLLLMTGEKEQQLFWDCVSSIRRHYPNAPIHAITDVPVDDDGLGVTSVNSRLGTQSRFYKTQLHRLTPFELSVFLDYDTVIHRPFGQAADWLKDCDIAMSSDYPRVPLHRRRSLFKKDPETLRLCNGRENWVYHNSGVIFFRRSVASHRLFDAWHGEWLRSQSTDQPALLRARVKTEVNIATLPPELNFVPQYDARHKPVSAWDSASVLHWTKRKDKGMPETYHTAAALKRGRPSPTYSAYRVAVERGQCSREQYRHIGQLIRNNAEAPALVFGAGFDSELWKSLNGSGPTTFIEDAPFWTDAARAQGCDVVSVAFNTRRGERAGVSEIEAVCNRIPPLAWKFILIDGPKGHRRSSPGVEIPILYAFRHRDTAVICLHDFERPWDYTLAMEHLGPPSYAVPGEGEHNSTLAVWLPRG